MPEGEICVLTNRGMHNRADTSEAGANLATGIRLVPVEDNDLLLVVV